MQAIFLPESIKDGIEAYGRKIDSSLEYSELTELLDYSDRTYALELTSAILTKFHSVLPGLPIKCCEDIELMDPKNPELLQTYSNTGLSTNSVEALQMLQCVVTRDGCLIMTKSDVPSDDSFLERVIKGMEDTQSIDDILTHEVSVYHCKNSN